MKKESFNPIIVGKPLPAIKLSPSARKFEPINDVVPPMDPIVALEAFKKTPAAMNIPDELPDILDPHRPPRPVAGFMVGGKVGTATYLDIWDSDHFDYVTDMGRNLSSNKVWFSGDGYDQWGSGQTKTGRINCYFRAPETRMYRCDATLQSHGSVPARVECIMDNSSFGMLTVNGTITQPHFRDLSAGYHAFRIRQVSGSFFFLSLMVYAT